MNISSDAKPTGKGFIFRLFVAGNEPHSKTAKDNLKKLCETRIDEPCETEVVDVLESYTIALENNIFVTPALKMISPAPAVTIFGDLSDMEEVIKALRLGGDQ
jgi:circadian clock protein KaiB